MNAASRRIRVLSATALLFLPALLYLPTVSHDFVDFDDDLYVTANPAIRQGLSARSIPWALTSLHAANWHPLTWLSHALDVTLFGLEPGGHHLTSLLLHTTATLLLFTLLKGLTGAFWRSLVVAALFGVHPLHVESVAWVAERKDLLCAVLGFLALGAYVSHARHPSGSRYALTVGLFAAGLLAKPMLVTLPALMLILDWWPLGRFAAVSRKRLVLEKVPLLLLSVLSGLVTLVAQSRGGALASSEVFPLAVRLKNAAVAYVAYLGKATFPTELTIFYPHPGPRLALWKFLAALLALAVVSGVVGRGAARRRAPFLLAGWGWYIVSLLPVIGLVQVGGQAIADRYTYIPLIGPCVALAWIAAEPTSNVPRRRWPVAAAALAMLLAFAAATSRQIPIWKDTATLFEHALAVDPRGWWAHNNLGNLAGRHGRHGAAEDHYRRAIALRPDWSLAHYNLALCLGAQERTAEAVPEYREALRLDPENAAVRNNLGSALTLLGDSAAAEAEFREAIRLKPGEVPARVNLATLLRERGDTESAETLYRAAVRIDPESAQARYNLGTLLAQRGDFVAAESEFRRAAELDPTSAEARNNLGAALAALDRPHDAAELFRQALRLRPDYASARENLARYQAIYGSASPAVSP